MKERRAHVYGSGETELNAVPQLLSKPRPASRPNSPLR